MPTLDLSKAVTQLLDQYGEDITTTVKQAIKEVAKEAVPIVQSVSPVNKHQVAKDKGRYRKGWTYAVTNEGYGMNTMTIYNKTDWQLTHLLNNGFYSVRAGRRIEGDGHIDKAETEINDLLIKKVEKEL